MIGMESIPNKIRVRYQAAGHQILGEKAVLYSASCDLCKINTTVRQQIDRTSIKLLQAKFYLTISNRSTEHDLLKQKLT